MKNILLTINREGAFKADTIKSAHVSQCGRVAKEEYQYKVSITATNKKLMQPFGFVVDNALVHDYFIETYEKGRAKCLSCELMSCAALEHFRSLFVGKLAPCKGVELVSIKVTIRGSDHSFIEGEWIAPKARRS